MKKSFLLSLMFVFGSVALSHAQVSVSDGTKSKTSFPVVTRSKTAIVCYDNADAEVVKKAVSLFVEDVDRVTGKRIQTCTSVPPRSEAVIFVGTLGNNKQIDRLVASGKIDVTAIRGGWEQYLICEVEHPFPNVSKALVIAGSDRRGTAYGLFSVSEAIGVSPWYWWADAPVAHKSSLSLNVTPFISKSPSVKYRGIFINDEDWGLKPWASRNFEPEVGDIGPKTYAKICELLLRLKANYLCPAMHSCTKAFNHYPGNKLVADSFGIVMGSVHCEPLLFNNASEWDKKTMGEWNYVTNRDGINKVLRKRVHENGNFENVYTLAMRGIHDAVMAGNLTLEQQARVLEKAFDDQREILSSEIGKPAEQIPQAFTPYKEVLETYDHGMNLPDDVTLVWSEDDFGYIKRLSNSTEQKRSGRSGVYYHVSYWGPPKHYLWIASTPPTLMYEELRKAYDTTADRLWVVNVGDIKPAEYSITLFMDMAYDIDRFSFDNINEHSVDFLCRLFGEKHRSDFADIQQTYFKLAFARKSEYMERSTDTEFSIDNYNEVDRRLAEYRRIADKAKAIMEKLDKAAVPAFFQLVYYNVKGAALVNEMTLSGQKNRLYALQQRATANLMRDKVKVCGDSLELITSQYNSLLGGKWEGMMSLIHGGARSFERARVDSVALAENPVLGVSCEGNNQLKGISNVLVLPCFNKYVPGAQYIDIFNKGKGTLKWKATASDSWIQLDRKAGKTRYEDRLLVSVDWKHVPVGENILGNVEIESDGGITEKVFVSVFNPQSPSQEELKGMYVEKNGYVSIDAAGFHRKHELGEVKFDVVNGLGFEGKVVRLGDPFAKTPYLDGLVLTSNYVAPARGNSFPMLEYDFYSFQTGPVDVYTYMMPIFPLSNEHGSRYGVMVDNSPVYLPEAGAPYYSTLWIQSVLRNCRINKTTHFINKPGKHTVKIFCAHPGMMLQKIVVDFGGLRKSYMGPEPTLVK
ncbi:glycosyl hydrolase 115 family protein [Bacteroides sp.]